MTAPMDIQGQSAHIGKSSIHELGELVSVRTLSQLLEIKERTIREWIVKRKVPYYKIGKFVRFDPNEIREFYKTGRVEPVKLEFIKDEVLRNGQEIQDKDIA